MTPARPDFWRQRRGPLSASPLSPEREDHARIVHSAAFRRLQGKRQVLGTPGGDLFRTRLTHSLEVAELGRAVLGELRRRAEQTQADWAAYLPGGTLLANICLAHDLGHPPFGHAGERALDAAMLELQVPGLGGFEANGQTLRLISKLEAAPESGHGLNLTRRLLLGVLKYPVAYSQAQRRPGHPPKCYLDSEQDVVDWLLAPLSAADRRTFTDPAGQHRSLDSRLMELADDAAYGVFDLEDGVNLELIGRSDWEELTGERPELQEIRELGRWAELIFSDDPSRRKGGVAALSRALTSGVRVRWQSLFEEPLLDLRAEFTPQAAALQAFLTTLVWQKVIDTPPIRQPEARESAGLASLFRQAQVSPDEWLGRDSRRRYSEAQSDAERARVVCDYLAGMTDSYALRQIRRLPDSVAASFGG